jgi:hypothetical protein
MFSRGAMSENAPDSCCASATSSSHLAKNAATSRLKQAVRANTWASPSQPSRSSRCGQSVGTLMKLPRWPQSMLRNSWFSQSAELSKDPVAGMSECTRRATMSPGPGSPG